MTVWQIPFCKRKTWGPYFRLLGPSAVTSTFANSVDVTAEGPNSLKYGPHDFLLQNCICQTVILLLTTKTTILDKKQPPRYCKNSRMPRGTNNCGWLLRGRKENCGKPCVGEFCRRHNFQLKNGGTNHAPCQGCGVGLKCHYRLCKDCGGNALRNRLYRKERKARQLFDRVLQELVATN